jgi:hypothetical protein
MIKYTYIYGKIQKCEVLKEEKEYYEIKTKNGNKRNIPKEKIFNEEKEVIKYLKTKNQATKLINKYEKTEEEKEIENIMKSVNKSLKELQ